MLVAGELVKNFRFWRKIDFLTFPRSRAEMIANAIGGISRANGDASEVSVLTVSASMAQRTKSVCEYATEA